jgi:Rrf2 family protein
MILVNNGGVSMKLSTRARYGTRALLDLAVHGRNGLVQLKDVARRQEISLHYLEHLIAPLIGAGMIRSTRGARGGVQLARPPAEVKLSEVIQLLEGPVAPVECVNNPQSCPQSDLCVTRDVWGDLNKAMGEILESTSLQDLVERREKKTRAEPAMYYV